MARFDPFRDMERLFAETLRTPASGVMPMDVYRDGESFVVQIDLPGVDPDSIDVDVDDQALTVRASRATDVEGEASWLTRERPTGAFARQLALGRGLALDKIQASYTDGVLRLVLPVAEEAKPRKISIQRDGRAPLTIEQDGTAENSEAPPQAVAS